MASLASSVGDIGINRSDILQAVRDANEAQRVLQDRLFVLESLLENLLGDEAEA
jgi:hypothetical protein